jgi:hypothetical protein
VSGVTTQPAARPALPKIGRRRLLLLVGSVAVFGLLPLFVLSTVLADLAAGGGGWTFRLAFLRAAEEVLRGENPYQSLDDPNLVDGSAYVYSPVVALVTIPFTWLPGDTGAFVFAGILIAAVISTLAALGVRDWRCYGIVFLWPPVLSGVHGESISILLALAAALVWRFRDRPARGGSALGISVAAKQLLWPLGLWFLVTRRQSALAWAVAVAVVLALSSWAVIGFDGLLDYPSRLSELSERMDEWGYSVYAVALDLGIGSGVARALWLVVALAVLAASVVVARRGNERGGFILAIAAVLACSPIVWLHYFALLLVVVAVAQPRLGPLWLVPLAMWGAEEVANGTTFQTALAIATAAATVALALNPGWARLDAFRMRPKPAPLAESP